MKNWKNWKDQVWLKKKKKKEAVSSFAIHDQSVFIYIYRTTSNLWNYEIKKFIGFLKNLPRQENFYQNFEELYLEKYEWEKHVGWSNIQVISLSLLNINRFENLGI